MERGFLRVGGSSRIPFFFGPWPVNLPNCRLLAAKVQENSKAKWVRVELRTSTAGFALCARKGRRAEAKHPLLRLGSRCCYPI